jgi:hypothetical protein
MAPAFLQVRRAKGGDQVRVRNALVLWVAALGTSLWAIGAPAATPGNDYPTLAIADYVYGCMKANGETPEALGECACSIDVLATLLPYERYEQASTTLSMMQTTGEAAGLFRASPEANAAIQDLRRAQAEADIRCFRSAS